MSGSLLWPALLLGLLGCGGDVSITKSRIDADGDGYAEEVDCDDAHATVNPGADEICDPADTNEVCDGLADDADSDATGASTWYADEDSDGYGAADNTVSACSAPSGTVANDDDCDDALATAHPGDYLGYDCCGRPIATGDEDGDGEGDLPLGTYNHDSSSKANAGVAWLFYGPLSGTYLGSSAYDAAFSGDDASDDCGVSALLADLDGDDNNEVVIGCDAGEISSTSEPGVVYVFDGG